MKKDSRIKLNLPEELSAQVRALIKANYRDSSWTPGTTPFCCELILDGIRMRCAVKLAQKTTK